MLRGRAKEENGDLINVKVDEMLCFMSDKGAKVPADDAVPGRLVFLVELLLDEGRNVLLHLVLLNGGLGRGDGVLLHLLAHVNILDDGLGGLGSGV